MSQERVLLVVDEVIGRTDDVPPEVQSVVDEASEVYVVAPALNSRLHSLCSDDTRARHEADERLHEVMSFLRRVGMQSGTGEVGDEDPLTAIDDALAEFEADSLVVAVHAHDRENWREHHLTSHLRDRFDLPLTLLTVDERGQVVARS